MPRGCLQQRVAGVAAVACEAFEIYCEFVEYRDNHNPIVVRSWNELNDSLFEGSWQQHIGRFRSHWAFRGIHASGSHLRTGLMRLSTEEHLPEHHLLRNFRKYAPHDLTPNQSLWNWLALAQHHGLPTRLLDWTYSPFVALHFATARPEFFEEDSFVWCVNYVRTNQFLPARLQDILSAQGSDVFTAEMLEQAAADLSEFDNLQEQEFVVFFEPPSLDGRITNQFALFSLLSNPRACLKDWLDAHPETWRQILIPAALKPEIRDKLDQANITERVLFPGLDGLSAWLTRYYSPKQSIKTRD